MAVSLNLLLPQFLHRNMDVIMRVRGCQDEMILEPLELGLMHSKCYMFISVFVIILIRRLYGSKTDHGQRVVKT